MARGKTKIIKLQSAATGQVIERTAKFVKRNLKDLTADHYYPIADQELPDWLQPNPPKKEDLPSDNSNNEEKKDDKSTLDLKE